MSPSIAISLLALLIALFGAYRTYLRGENLTVVVANLGWSSEGWGSATLIFTNAGSVPVAVLDISEVVDYLEVPSGSAPIVDHVLDIDGRPVEPLTVKPATLEMIQVRVQGAIIKERTPGSYELILQVEAVGPSGSPITRRVPMAYVTIEGPPAPSKRTAAVHTPTLILDKRWRRRLQRLTRRVPVVYTVRRPPEDSSAAQTGAQPDESA